MRKQKLPHVEKIVAQRIAVHIAGDAEYQLYIKGDLEDAAYSAEFKQQLLKELAEARQQKKSENIR